MSGLEISKTICPFRKGHQIAIENNGVNLAYITIGGGAWGLGAGGSVALLQTKMDVFDITSDIGDLRAHIFCLQTTQ